MRAAWLRGAVIQSLGKLFVVFVSVFFSGCMEIDSFSEYFNCFGWNSSPFMN